MGIVHPLSDDYGAVLSPERTPPSSPLPPGNHCLEHEVSRMDTLAGIAIKYGVEVIIPPSLPPSWLLLPLWLVAWCCC
jgi:hypothetical protein